MVFKTLMPFLALLLLSCADAARAQTACSMVDNIAHTASIVQDIHAAQNAKDVQEHMNQLKTRTELIILSEVIHPDSAHAFPKESAAMSHYLFSLRDALENADAGYQDSAKQKLEAARSPDFAPSLKSLEYYWNCRNDNAQSVIDAPDHRDNAFYSAAPDTDPKPDNNGTVKAVTGKSNTRNAPSTSRNLYGAKASRSALLLDNASIIPALIIMLFTGGAYLWRRRAKQYRSREARRYLYTPVVISLGTKKQIATLIDISRNGTKIKHEGRLLGQKKLTLELAGDWYSGDIMWSNDFFAGVRFKKPITRNTFNALVKSAMTPQNTDTHALID